MIRHRATDRARPLGTLFFNPGGPGAPGTDLLPTTYDNFPAELRARFDIASWDPRGVGRSTAVLNSGSCANDYVSEYVIDGALPPKGTRCSQDRPPFTGSD